MINRGVGIALIRVAVEPHRNGTSSTIEEFYAVLFDGNLLQPRFTRYSEAHKYAEQVRAKFCAYVA